VWDEVPFAKAVGLEHEIVFDEEVCRSYIRTAHLLIGVLISVVGGSEEPGIVLFCST
jgi:hypothetical protein